MARPPVTRCAIGRKSSSAGMTSRISSAVTFASSRTARSRGPRRLRPRLSPGSSPRLPLHSSTGKRAPWFRPHQETHPRPILLRRRDRPVADDGVPVIEHRGLPGSDAVGGLVELEPEATGGGLDAGRHRRRAVAELRLDPVGVRVEPAADVHLRAGERGARADDDRVRGRPRAEDVERLGRGEAQATPLPGREAPEAVVAAELAPVLRDDRPLLSLEAVPTEEGAVVVACEEACLLAFRTAGGREAGALRLGPGRLLVLVAEREHDPRELLRVERGEHVALVLGRVRSAGEEEGAVPLDDARVVPGGEPPGSGAPREGEQLGEAEAAVAARARVWRPPARIATDERRDDGAAELLAQVEGHVRHVQ